MRPPQYRVEFKRSANKEWLDLPENIRQRVLAAVTALGTNPRPVGCTKLMGFDNCWRIRVGDYRILYEIHNDSSRY